MTYVKISWAKAKADLRLYRRRGYEVKPNIVDGRLCGYFVEDTGNVRLPNGPPPLKVTKYNVARALYCINKYAKWHNVPDCPNPLYQLKDRVLRVACEIGWARPVALHVVQREDWYDEDAVRTEKWELVQFSVFRFHRRPRYKEPLPSEDLGDWYSDHTIRATKPIAKDRARDLLVRFCAEHTSLHGGESGAKRP